MERLNFVSSNGTFHGKRGFPETYTKISERNFFVFTSSRRFGLDCPWELERAHPRGKSTRHNYYNCTVDRASFPSQQPFSSYRLSLAALQQLHYGMNFASFGNARPPAKCKLNMVKSLGDK